jgi:hypothetical protein
MEKETDQHGRCQQTNDAIAPAQAASRLIQNGRAHKQSRQQMRRQWKGPRTQ